MKTRLFVVIAVGAVSLCQACQQGQQTTVQPASPAAATADGWRQTFSVDKSHLGQEISRNYFAIDRATGDLYYFGEDVDMYKDGKVVSHDGAWLSGVNGARFGLMMPGHPKVGDRFYQEIAPGVAMDRAEIVSIDEKVATPAGSFERCLQVKETTPLEKDVSRKQYAPGVGLLKDGGLSLVGPLPKKP